MSYCNANFLHIVCSARVVNISTVFQLTNCKRLRDAIRNELFPTDEMIASLGREFGIPLTTEDLEGITLFVLVCIVFFSLKIFLVKVSFNNIDMLFVCNS